MGAARSVELASTEPLLALPELPFPAEHQAERVVADDALVAFESNRYSVPPSYAAQTVTVRARLGDMHLEIYSQAGRRIARHRRAPTGARQVVRSPEHARLLERAVLDAFTTPKACPRKPNRPPGERALGRGRPPARPGPRRGGCGSRSVRADREGRRPAMNKHASYQDLRAHLAYLKFAAAAEHLPAALEQAEKDKPGYTQFLHDLLDVEVQATEQRRLAGRMRFAGFPSTKTLEEFDFTAQPGIDRALVNELATLRFVQEKANLLVDRPARCGQDDARDRARPQGGAGGLPRALHHCRRSRGPHQPRRRARDGGRTRCGSGPDRRS